MKDRQLTLQRIGKRLNDAEIPYMATGSFASGFHSQWRATQDLDLVIDPTEVALQTLVERLQGEYYADMGAAMQAFRGRGMFNVIDLTTGWKVDLIIRKDTPYHKVAFERRDSLAELREIGATVSTAEDSILSKLIWSRRSQSELQKRDVMGILATRWKELDWNYLRQWADDVGVREELESMLVAVEELRGPGNIDEGEAEA